MLTQSGTGVTKLSGAQQLFPLLALPWSYPTLTGRYRVLLPAPLHDRRAYRSLNTSQDATAA
jgi:hypothetical protein